MQNLTLFNIDWHDMIRRMYNFPDKSKKLDNELKFHSYLAPKSYANLLDLDILGYHKLRTKLNAFDGFNFISIIGIVGDNIELFYIHINYLTL